MEEHKNVIGDRVKELRGAMSQRQAAACVGVKPQNWNVYESGQSLPGSQVVINLCRYFAVSSDWLLGLSDVREVSNAFAQTDWRSRALMAEQKLARVSKALGHALKGFEELQEAIR